MLSRRRRIGVEGRGGKATSAKIAAALRCDYSPRTYRRMPSALAARCIFSDRSMRFHASTCLRLLACATAYLALIGVASPAAAGGQPIELGTQTGIHDGQSGIVLDTQTGIHDGQSGVVLQNAPLSRAPMVPAQQLPTLEQPDAAGGQPPIVVAPYIALPGANAATPGAGAAYRASSGNRQ